MKRPTPQTARALHTCAPTNDFRAVPEPAASPWSSQSPVAVTPCFSRHLCGMGQNGTKTPRETQTPSVPGSDVSPSHGQQPPHPAAAPGSLCHRVSPARTGSSSRAPLATGFSWGHSLLSGTPLHQEAARGAVKGSLHPAPPSLEPPGIGSAGHGGCFQQLLSEPTPLPQPVHTNPIHPKKWSPRYPRTWMHP